MKQNLSEVASPTNGDGRWVYPYIHICIKYYHRTLRGLQNDELPTLQPGTRSRRDLWRRDTKLRVLVRGVLLGRGAAVRALLATCPPSPCALKVLRKPEAFPLRGLGPPRTDRVRGVASVVRAGPGEVPQLFWVQENQSLCNTCLLYTSPSPRDGLLSRMPSSA